MTTDDLRALLDAACAATPGPWEWDGSVWDYNPEQEAPWLMAPAPIRRPIIQGEVNCSFANANYIAAASPDVVAHLCRIALAAVEHERVRSTVVSERARNAGEYDAAINAMLQSRADLVAAIADAGLLTTAPQEPQP